MKHPKHKDAQYTPKDLDLSQLQCPPYKIVYLKSNSPTAIDLTNSNITRNGQDMTKTDYAKILKKHYPRKANQ